MGNSLNKQVAVFGTLRFPPENIEEVLPHLYEFVRATNEKDDCIAYDVAEDPFDKGLIRFSEMWPDRESLNAHLEADHIVPWREQARKYGLLERRFNSYDVSSEAIPV